jgi:hypothetical protein
VRKRILIEDGIIDNIWTLPRTKWNSLRSAVSTLSVSCASIRCERKFRRYSSCLDNKMAALLPLQVALRNALFATLHPLLVLMLMHKVINELWSIYGHVKIVSTLVRDGDEWCSTSRSGRRPQIGYESRDDEKNSVPGEIRISALQHLDVIDIF